MREKEGTVKLISLGWFLGVLLFDRLTKFFFLKNSRIIINRGVSWGIAATFSPALLTLFSLLILAFCSLLLFVYPRKFGLWLIAAGGAANLLDRIFYGGVVDFISLPLLPAFNLADVAICLGGFFLLVDFLKTQKIS
jgi:signal peptidase II